MEETNKLYGIRGWLAALIILFVLSSLLSIAIAADELRNNLGSGSVEAFFRNKLILAVATSAVPLYAAYRMVKTKNWWSVWWGIAAAWIGWAGAGMGMGILFVQATDQMPARFFTGLTLMVAFSAIVTAYLLRSVRVKNTYGNLKGP